jgi:mono/diheme cytochrome c family protein
MREAACIGLGAALLSACAASPPSPPGLADPVHGERLFNAACSGYCHATPAGTGGEAPLLWDCEWIHGADDTAIFRTISMGVPGTDMPAFGSSLADEDLWNLVAYLRSASRCTARAPPAPPAQSGRV